MGHSARNLWIRRAFGVLVACLLFSRTVHAASVTLAWDPNSEPTVTGYILSYGTTSGTYATSVDAGNLTQWTVAGLTNGQQYFFAVRAYDGTGAQSPLSTEVSTVAAAADLTVAIAHTGNFSQGQVGATYTVTVSNVGLGQVVGAVTLADTLPAGLTATAMSGSGWTCTVATPTCTNNNPLGGGAAYSPIALTVTVANNAAASLTNSATVSGGGETNTANDTATDVTTVTPLTPDVTVTSTHVGSFAEGQVGATYTLTVSNVGNAPTAGTVTVVDALPAG